MRDWTEAERNLALYLLTNEHRNLEGLYRLPLAYIQEDLDWQPGTVEAALSTLLEAGFIRYDERAKVVLIPKAMKFHQPGSARQIQGAINALQKVPDTALWSDFVEACRLYCPALYDAIAEGIETDA